jgi:hypothetical protein
MDSVTARRAGNAEHMVRYALFLESRRCEYLNRQVVVVDEGGLWLTHQLRLARQLSTPIYESIDCQTKGRDLK